MLLLIFESFDIDYRNVTEKNETSTLFNGTMKALLIVLGPLGF
jgi:hypothetical protein